MAERFKAPVLKFARWRPCPSASVLPNPCLSWLCAIVLAPSCYTVPSFTVALRCKKR